MIKSNQTQKERRKIKGTHVQRTYKLNIKFTKGNKKSSLKLTEIQEYVKELSKPKHVEAT